MLESEDCRTMAFTEFTAKGVVENRSATDRLIAFDQLYRDCMAAKGL